jgi:hypothetical protein
MHAVNLIEPTDDLRLLGEKLQAVLHLTALRLEDVKTPALKVRTMRAINKGRYIFNNIRTMVQLVDSLAGFLNTNMGISVDDIFSYAGKSENAARVTTRGAVELLNDGIRRAMSELNEVNIDIEKEVSEHVKKEG